MPACVAVTRGGLIPAAIVARELECRVVESVSIVSYGGEAEASRGTPVVTKPPTAAGDGTGFLIVDDLVDTGSTARVVRALLPRAHFACIYAKPASAGGGGQFRHRGVAGHLDPVPVGHRAAVHRAAGAAWVSVGGVAVEDCDPGRHDRGRGSRVKEAGIIHE